MKLRLHIASSFPASSSRLLLTLSLACCCHLSAQTAYNPLVNSVATPRPFEPGSASSNPSALTLPSPNAYLGSIPSSAVAPGVLPLSMQDAVVRALHANLGLFNSEQDHAQSRAARIRALSVLLPQLSAEAAEVFRNFPVNTIGGQRLGLPSLISNFNYQTASLSLHQNVLDISAMHEVKASQDEEEMSAAALADARNIVVLAASSAYLQVSASESRVRAAASELGTSQGLEALLKDRVEREVSPEIDALRATVTRQTAEQRLVLAQVRLQKDKMALARIIGLKLQQQFRLTDAYTAHPAPELTADQRVQEANAARQDLRASTARVAYAQQLLKAQSSQRLPTVDVRANAGEVGVNFGHDYGTYEVEGRISVPLFTGRRIEAGILSAQATLRRRRAELEDLKERIRYDVESSVLDLQAADTSVAIAEANLKLAQQGLRESKDRFDAGVSNSLELIQAQQATATADDNNIASIYAQNLAKLMLLRSTGTAEQNYILYMGVQQ